MALDITAIREKLAVVIESVVESSEYPANVQAYPSGTPPMPAWLIFPAPFENGQYVNYWGTFGNHMCAVGLRIEIRVSSNDVDAARQLDLYLSTVMPDIIETITADPTLGGVAESVFLRDAAVPGVFAPAEGDTRTWLSASIAVEVHQRRGTP